jgi:hypothetical protein
VLIYKLETLLLNLVPSLATFFRCPLPCLAPPLLCVGRGLPRHCLTNSARSHASASPRGVRTTPTLRGYAVSACSSLPLVCIFYPVRIYVPPLLHRRHGHWCRPLFSPPLSTIARAGPELLRTLGCPCTYVGPGYFGLAQHKIGSWAQAWAVGAVHGPARHDTIGSSSDGLGLARSSRSHTGPGLSGPNGHL